MEDTADPDVNQIRRMLERCLPDLQARYGVESLGIFGSYVRQEQSQRSDLDILVTFSETPSLLTFVALENDLSDLLGVSVDLVMKSALKPHLGRRILEEALPV